MSEAKAWLDQATDQSHSTAVSYAAFELRLAIERIALEYYRRMRNDVLDDSDFSTTQSFKRIENRIYELEGHQRTLDAKFDFMTVVMRAMNMPFTLARPNLGVLSRYWHACSNLCHVNWTLAVAANPQLTVTAKRELAEIEAYLRQFFAGIVVWPVIQDPAFETLRDDFVAGRIAEADVLANLKKVGVWARLERPGQPNEFVGTAIPPTK